MIRSENIGHALQSVASANSPPVVSGEVLANPAQEKLAQAQEAGFKKGLATVKSACTISASDLGAVPAYPCSSKWLGSTKVVSVSARGEGKECNQETGLINGSVTVKLPCTISSSDLGAVSAYPCSSKWLGSTKAESFSARREREKFR